MSNPSDFNPPQPTGQDNHLKTTTHRTAIVTIDGYNFEFLSSPSDTYFFLRKTGVGILINPSTAEIDSIKYINALSKAVFAVMSWLGFCEWLDKFEATEVPYSGLCEQLIKDIKHLISSEVMTFEENYIKQLTQTLHTVETAHGLAIEREESERSERIEKNAERRRGYVYLLKSADGTYKIGCTKNPENRLKTFEVKLPNRVEFIALLKTSDMRFYERELHWRFTRKRVSGE